jgi:hypothetical protein
MTALAADLHRRLRTEAETRGVYKADVVLDAFANHMDDVRDERRSEQRDGRRPRERRRKTVVDATQCQLYLSDAERDMLDAAAADVGLSRSEMVSRLLELELDGATTT